MSSKFERVAVIDSNRVANEIMHDIIDVDKMERMPELSSEDLFRIDCAILSSLRKTEDFSRDLLKQLECGMFKTEAPPKDVLFKDTVTDITVPLQDMFDEMVNMVSINIKESYV